MTLPFRMLGLAAKLGALSEMSAFSSMNCRITHRYVNVWIGQRYSHKYRDTGLVQNQMIEEPEMEDAEVKMQALANETKKWQKTVKYRMIEKKMTAPGAPERRLTWDAIEQIRYLKRERPEEWTAERLAEGFSVSTDVIVRVLRSKSVPTPERKARQDAKVTARWTRNERPLLPAEGSPAALETTVARQALLTARKDSGTLVVSSGGPPSLLPTQLSVLPAVHTKHATHARSIEGKATKANEFTGDIDEEEGEMWDGQVFTEEEVEQMMPMAKISPVMQIENDVFDAEGNFLYRI